MRAVLLLGPDENVRNWQLQALEQAIGAGLEVVQIAHCQDSTRRKLSSRNAIYYLFAFTSRRNMKALRTRSIRPLIADNVPSVRFYSEWNGMWQRIPDSVSAEFAAADVVIKFGMSLLKDPDSIPVEHGVLSYHHGEPEHFRGRPAGFHEMRAKAEILGVIVQRLSNTLDGGEVIARAYSRVLPYSYTRTLEGVYDAGVPLLATAIAHLRNQVPRTPPKHLGPNFRLPSNSETAKLWLSMGREMGKRLAYGLFREKQWRVGFLPGGIDPETSNTLHLADIQQFDLPGRYTFVADPVGEFQSSLYCEAMSRATGKGEIVRLRDSQWEAVDLGLEGSHVSYPQVVKDKNSTFLFPEISTSLSPRLFELSADGARVESVLILRGLEDQRVVDGTLARLGSTWFLFAGTVQSSANRLNLWSAPDLSGPYTQHPESPVHLDPRGARMAGPLVTFNGNLYRFGQDCSRNYGGSVRIYRITELTQNHFAESYCGSIQFSDAWGPHSVLWNLQGAWVDFYSEASTPSAGLMRIKNRLGRRKR